MSVFIWLYITILLYFGANTTWYLQFHFECAKLLISSLFMTIPPLFFIVRLADLNLIILWRLFFSTHSFKLFEPPVKLGVFIVQAKGILFPQDALFIYVCRCDALNTHPDTVRTECSECRHLHRNYTFAGRSFCRRRSADHRPAHTRQAPWSVFPRCTSGTLPGSV